MRPTFLGIEIGKKAILTQRTAMDVTSHNIANANTEGYARQRAVISPTNPWTIPSFHAPVTGQQLGTGVEVTKIQNFRDMFIDRRITLQQSALKEYELANDILKEVEAILNEPNEATVKDMFEKFWSAWQDLSINPASSELRINLLEKSQNLVSFFNETYKKLENFRGFRDHSFQGSLENQLEDIVKSINNLLGQISNLNIKIETQEIANGQANDLRDQRQKLLEELSQLVEINFEYDSKGHLRIRIGHELVVDHGIYKTLSIVTKNGYLPNTVYVGEDYPELSNNPNIVSATYSNNGNAGNFTVGVEQVATAHKLETLLSFFPITGSLADFGITSGTIYINGKMFYIDAEHTTLSMLASMISSANINVRATINDAGKLELNSALTGTNYKVNFVDGTSNLFRVLNLQTKISPQNAVFTINGKKFISQSNIVKDPIPGVTLEIKNVGVAEIDARSIIIGGKLKSLLNIRDNEIYTLLDRLDELAWRLVTEVNNIHRQGFGLNGKTGLNFFNPILTDDINRPYKNAAKLISISNEIVNDTNNIAAAGGIFVNPNDKLPQFGGVGNGSNAIKIAQLKHTFFFNDGKATFDEFYSAMVTEIANKSQRYERMHEYQKDLINQLEAKRQELSGVSLDEELTNLIKFQHAYNAAAKAISTADAMLDKIINGMI